MKNRKFLVPLAALTAAFTTTSANALLSEGATAPQTDSSNISVAKVAAPDHLVTVSNGNDDYSFILKRSEAGMLMAAHYSHRSHSSHSSHSSHRSHYSGY